MQTARIAELLQPFLSPTPVPADSELDRTLSKESEFLSTKQLDHISTYIDILRQWNARINLTAVRDPEEIVTRHFVESLFAARCLRLTTSHIETEPIRLADLGSGAGFPRIPIKLWMSDV